MKIKLEGVERTYDAYLPLNIFIYTYRLKKIIN